MCKSFGIFFCLHFATFAFLCGEVVVGATAILSADALDDIDRCNFCHSVNVFKLLNDNDDLIVKRLLLFC